MSSLLYRNQFLALVVKTYAKSRYQRFLVLSYFARFSYFLSKILSRAADIIILAVHYLERDNDQVLKFHMNNSLYFKMNVTFQIIVTP